MPLPEIWFVYDRSEGEFNIFPSEAEAQAAYDKTIKQINDAVGQNDEYEGDEQVFMGTVNKRAKVVPVEFDTAIGEDRYALCSFTIGGA
jgi:hypothetical protein